MKKKKRTWNNVKYSKYHGNVPLILFYYYTDSEWFWVWINEMFIKDFTWTFFFTFSVLVFCIENFYRCYTRSHSLFLYKMKNYRCRKVDEKILCNFSHVCFFPNKRANLQSRQVKPFSLGFSFILPIHCFLFYYLPKEGEDERKTKYSSRLKI